MYSVYELEQWSRSKMDEIADDVKRARRGTPRWTDATFLFRRVRGWLDRRRHRRDRVPCGPRQPLCCE